MKHLSILVFSLLFTSGLFAQANFKKGYIIKSNNDTIYGEIDYQSDTKMGKVCTFQSKEGDAKTAYTPTDLIGYRFTDGKFFITKDWEGNRVFMEYLVNGLVRFYYYRGEGGDHYFIEKDGEKMAELPYKEIIVTDDNKTYLQKSTRHIGVLTYYLKDAPVLQSEINTFDQPSHKNLIRLGEEYHNAVCTDGQKCIIYEKKLPAMKIDLEARGSYLSNLSSSYNFSAFQPGLLAHIWLPRVNENTFFRTGIQVFNIKDNLGYTYNYLQIPLSGEYVFPVKGIVQPKFVYGFNIYFATGMEGFFNFNPFAETGININLSKSIYLSVNLNADFQPWEHLFLIPYGFNYLGVSAGFGVRL